MKIFLICISFYSLSCNTNQQSNKSIETNMSAGDTTFQYHFNLLDSAAKANPNDTVYHCCTQSIKFMEIKTDIESRSDGTLLGKLSFTKQELQKWHEWYDKKYKKDK